MTAIVYKGFTGEQPRLEPHLLPNNAAQYAMNCEFDSGALAPMKGGLLRATMLSNPVKGAYSHDGINAFSWPVEAHAFQSPVIDDGFGRMYFLLPSSGIFSAGLQSEMRPDGPTPYSTFRAGVPQPIKAPILKLIDRTDIPEYPSVEVVVEAWWEDNSKQYGRVGVSLTQVVAFKSYTFPLPPKPADTPAGATLGMRFSAKDLIGGTMLVFITVKAPGSARSNGFPGGVEIGLSSDSTLARVDITWGVTETRAYTYTLENSWNEESAPAPPATISPTYMQDVEITGASLDFTGFRPYREYHVYRTYGTNTTYIRTKVVPGAGESVLDSSRSPSSVGQALESMDWYPSPLGLQGATAMPGGWFAAFSGNNLHMSEPYRPHAWPYVQKFPHSIRGIKPTQGGLVVTTAAGVYLLSGIAPIATSQTQLSLPQAGLSQRSMAEIDGAVAYASNDGFPLVGGASATMSGSQKLFTRKVWRERYGDSMTDNSMQFAYSDGCLVMASSARSEGFMLRLDEDIGALTRTNVRMDATLQVMVADTLFYSVGNQVYGFRQGAAQEFNWRGKEFVFQNSVAFGVGHLRSSGPVTLTLYAEGVQVHEAVINNGHFTIPDINGALRWSVRLRGTSTVYELALAKTFKDLRNV